MQKGKKTQKENPHNLTIKQHIFPKRSIERFCNKTGVVNVYLFKKEGFIESKPGNEGIFCAKRVWGHCDEHGYMKNIEDKFQCLVNKILKDNLSFTDNEQKIITDFFILLHLRSKYNEKPMEDVKLNGIKGDNLSADMQEQCEKSGASFIQSDATVPAHLSNGLEIQIAMDRYRLNMKNKKWGIVQALEEEFIVPDYFEYMIIPIAPKISLVADVETGNIKKANLKNINTQLFANCRKYYFLRSKKFALHCNGAD